MTTTLSTQPTETDPRAILAEAMSVGDSVICAVRPEQMQHPTPCAEYDVRTLLGHLVGVLHNIAAVGRGEIPSTAGRSANLRPTTPGPTPGRKQPPWSGRPGPTRGC